MVAKGPHLLRLTRSITRREREQAGHSATFDRLWELYEDESEEASAVTATAAVVANASAGYIAAAAAAAAASAACGSSSAMAVSTEVSAENTPTGCSTGVGREGFLHGDVDVSARLGAVGIDGRSKDDDEETTASMGARVGGDVNETDIVQRNADLVAINRGAGEAAAAAGAAAGAERRPRRPSSGRSSGATSAADRPGSSLRRPRSATSLTGNRASFDGEHGLVQEQDVVTGAGGEGGEGAVRQCWGGDAETKWTGFVIGEGRGEEVEEEEEDEEDEEERGKEDEEEEEDARDGGLADRRGSSGSGRTKASPNGSTRKSRKSGGGGGGTRRGTGGAGAATRWAWKKDLCDLLKRIGGLDKVIPRKSLPGVDTL